jgi:CheY-like chemotaxis protein
MRHGCADGGDHARGAILQEVGVCEDRGVRAVLHLRHQLLLVADRDHLRVRGLPEQLRQSLAERVVGIEDENTVHGGPHRSRITPGTSSALSATEQEAQMRARILLVEGTPDVARAVASMLETNRFEVVRVDDDRRAVERIATDHFDVLVVEVRATTDDGGLRFLRHVKAAVPHLTPRIVVISNDPPPSVQRDLDAIGVCDILLKPVHETEILNAIEECLDRTPATVH